MFSSLIPSHLWKVTKFLFKICQFKFLVMTDKNIFVYKPFLSLNISDFSFSVYFLYKNCTPPSWKHPYLSLQPPSETLKSKNWDPVKPLLFENVVEGSTPYEVCLNLTIMTQFIWAPLFKSCEICHEITLLDKWSRKYCIVTFTFTSHKCQKWRHQHLGTFHIFIFHIRCV